MLLAKLTGQKLTVPVAGMPERISAKSKWARSHKAANQDVWQGKSGRRKTSRRAGVISYNQFSNLQGQDQAGAHCNSNCNLGSSQRTSFIVRALLLIFSKS